MPYGPILRSSPQRGLLPSSLLVSTATVCFGNCKIIHAGFSGVDGHIDSRTNGVLVPPLHRGPHYENPASQTLRPETRVEYGTDLAT